MDGVVQRELDVDDGGELEQSAEIDRPDEPIAGHRGEAPDVTGCSAFSEGKPTDWRMILACSDVIVDMAQYGSEGRYLLA